jgi:adenylosuccinate lyase
MARLGLVPPAISWTSARDRFAEFVLWLALVTATLDKIGHEVYNLQRSEIGELAEPASAGGVGSITMPQKRIRNAASISARWPGWCGATPT